MKYFYHSEKLSLKFSPAVFDKKLPRTKYFHKNVSYTQPCDYKTQNRSTVNESTTTWTQKIENLVKLC